MAPPTSAATWRSAVFDGHGGKFVGHWTGTEKNGAGTFYHRNGLIYDGQYRHNLRDGHGSVRRVNSDGNRTLVYAGEWRRGRKHGEGKQYFADGVYYGWWRDGHRHGLGIMWYTPAATGSDASQYMGEWAGGKQHGVGILWQANGNRYEGNFRDGQKHGEGMFYHRTSGQVQKGIWVADICRTSIVQNGVGEAAMASPWANRLPIPKTTLCSPTAVMCDSFRQAMAQLGDRVCDRHEQMK